MKEEEEGRGHREGNRWNLRRGRMFFISIANMLPITIIIIIITTTTMTNTTAASTATINTTNTTTATSRSRADTWTKSHDGEFVLVA
jgi:hypothetical protein